MKSAKASLGVGILGVPERADRISRLLQQLGLNDTAVAWDPQHDGHVPNWWRAIDIARTNKPSHLLILEDDAEPCRDFIPAVLKLIEQYPDRIISFFTTEQLADLEPAALKLESHYHVLSDVAMVYPRYWIESLRADFTARQTELAQTRWQLSYGADEMRNKLRPRQAIWNTVPSLVQHGCPQQSTLGHTLPRSLARPFIGNHVSALTLDWSQL